MTKLALLAVVALGAAGSLVADQGDKITIVTTDQAMELPNTTLQPGTYVIKLAKSGNTTYNTVQFFDKDERRLLTTVIAYPNERIRPTSKSMFSFWEVPAGQPKALRAWFYPGDADGQEFAYPKAKADRIWASNNNAKVPIDEKASVAAAASAPAAAEPAQAVRTEPAPPPAPVETVAAAEPPAAVVTPEPEPRVAVQNDSVQNDSDSRLLAQNTTPAAPEGLPRTASEVPLVALVGLSAVIGALVLRFRRSVNL
jgi:hypothetical protein